MRAEAAISTTVKLLSNLLIEKGSLLKRVEGEVRLLKDELIRMRYFLRDAYKKQAQNDLVRNWILDIREVALDAEDAFEMLILNAENKSRSLPGRRSIGNEIKSLRSKLEVIRKKQELYRIKDLGEPGEYPARSKVEVRRQLAPGNKDECLVGMDEDVKKLLEPILDEDKKGLSVAAVVGVGGIGKSTLAREVYNHPDVVFSRFECRAWVVVSREFTPQETVKELILQTTRSEEKKQQLRHEIKQIKESTRDRKHLESKLKELLHKRLEGKTYFIVLDNVSAKEHWDSLITAFPDEQDETSRLLLTTRENAIAKLFQSLHEVKILDREKSWELFLKKALMTSNSNERFPKKLEKVGRQIVEKCDGIPLLITVIGGLLAVTRSRKAWEGALNEMNSYLRSTANITSVIMELSYQNLSPQLKSCFLCLAFFKEDATVPLKRLVNIMVGQGLIEQTGKTTTEEEIARGYVDELINRNMIRVKDLTLDNRVKSCHLHDSFRKICLEKAKEEIGLEFLKRWSGSSRLKVRHRVVLCDGFTFIPVYHNPHLRSLFLFNAEEDDKESVLGYWRSFQHLKILDLDCGFPIRELSDSFHLPPGLKQLTIRRQTNKIFFNDLFNPSSRPLKLPIWLNTLRKLELLDLGVELVEFPNVPLEMYSLRHFRAYCVRGGGPTMTDSWKNVEILKYISYKDWMRGSLRVMDNCRIRELGMYLDDESSTLSVSLEKLKNLVKLYLLWNYLLPVEAAINIPHLGNLTKLKLNGMMRKCPSAIMLPPNLSHLTLENSFLDEDPMEELGRLPNLLYLKLKDHSYMGERMQVLHGDFPCLIGLHLRELYELRSVVIREGGMPQLKLLQVRDCYALDAKNLSDKSYHLQILDTI